MAERIERKDTGYYKSLIAAIQSLDSLNDQIVQFIFSPNSYEPVTSSVRSQDTICHDTAAGWNQQRDNLKSSMALMRRLLLDAQAKFRKMMEENKTIASRIERDVIEPTTSDMAGNILTTCVPLNVEVPNSTTSCAELNSNVQTISDTNSNCTSPQTIVEDSAQDNQPTIDAKCERCKKCTHDDANQLEHTLAQLQEQNEKLMEHNINLKKEVEELKLYKNQTESDENNLKPQLQQLETDLKHAKEALAALKQDRKRLKAEKFDLLNQMKQLYGTLEEKERELRDFIRSYEQKMKDSDKNLKQLVREREDTEREKWNILKHARDEAERSVALCAQLGLKEAQIKQMQEELNSVRERLGYMSDLDSSRTYRSNGYHSPSTASTHIPNGRDGSNAATPTPGSDPTTSSSCAGTPTITVDSDASPSHVLSNTRDCHRPNLPGLSQSAEEIYNSSGGSDCSTKKSRKRREGKGTWGSISRVFARGRQRKSIESTADSDQRSSWSPQSSLCASPLTEESYMEKLKLLEEAQGTPMERWKASTVLAWLEVSLGMPQYGAMCAENIKSGKVLLELSDPELETGLGITNIVHRRKLRLAIEEHREPSLCLYPKICLLTHTWIAEEWLPSLGLSCYVDNFTVQLIDGRVLDTLTKKDLEKYLGVTRKFHQVSIMHGIQLLRMVKFDRQILSQRRSHSENMDVDPLVWTNQRFIKWVRSIDLVEYAENLRDSGVHGALVVLEPSFTADTMATALGIPASKNIIRRHLTTELENLVQPARMSLEAEEVVHRRRNEKKASQSSGGSSVSGSLGRNFMRSYSRSGTLERPDKRRASMRGSLTRALGLKVRQELNRSPSFHSTPPLPKSSDTNKRFRYQGHIESLTVTPV